MTDPQMIGIIASVAVIVLYLADLLKKNDLNLVPYLLAIGFTAQPLVDFLQYNSDLLNIILVSVVVMAMQFQYERVKRSRVVLKEVVPVVETSLKTELDTTEVGTVDEGTMTSDAEEFKVMNDRPLVLESDEVSYEEFTKGMSPRDAASKDVWVEEEPFTRGSTETGNNLLKPKKWLGFQTQGTVNQATMSCRLNVDEIREDSAAVKIYEEKHKFQLVKPEEALDEEVRSRVRRESVQSDLERRIKVVEKSIKAKVERDFLKQQQQKIPIEYDDKDFNPGLLASCFCCGDPFARARMLDVGPGVSKVFRKRQIEAQIKRMQDQRGDFGHCDPQMYEMEKALGILPEECLNQEEPMRNINNILHNYKTDKVRQVNEYARLVGRKAIYKRALKEKV